MLSWSNAKYKLTLGVGSLAVAGMLSELWKDVLPVWVALGVALLPFLVFLFVHPGELSDRVVRVAHVAASVWYAIVAVGLLVSLTTVQPLPRGWPLYPLFVLVGAVPCGIVLYRVACGRYHPSDSTEGLPRSKSIDQTWRGERSAEREYEYRPKWTIIVSCAVLFGLGTAYLGSKAANNDRGVIINHIIELGPKGATTFYWLLAALSAGFVAIPAFLAYHRLSYRQRLVVGATALTVPASRWSRKEKDIAYRDILALSEATISGQRLLNVTHLGGKYTISASMLPSKVAFAEVCELLDAKVRAVSSAD